MKSPVIQVLFNAAQQEEDRREAALRAVVVKHLDLPPPEAGDRSGYEVFREWGEVRDFVPLPARPATVAFFCLEQKAFGLAELLRIVRSISLEHDNVADPTLSPMVAAALNKIKPIPEPRSWPATEKIRFRSLPYETQQYLHDRDRETTTAVRRAQNIASEAQKELRAMKQPAKATDDNNSKPTAAA